MSVRQNAPQFLSGWKEIANYLGKGVRTVQRYERELGFPVRRPAGKSHAAVIATKAEIDAWVAASPIREEFQLPRTQTNSQKAALNDIKERMERMGELRDQMRALRMELRASTRNLAESIERIHGEIANRWRSSHALDHPLFSEPLNSESANDDYAADTSTGDMTQRKAN
jgi:predicted DNA-binding transcriptional regulator AlpA